MLRRGGALFLLLPPYHDHPIISAEESHPLPPLQEKADESSCRFTMISVLAQERLLGAALGFTFTGLIVFEHRRSIYESISDTRPYLPYKSQIREPIFGSQFRSEFAHLWNKAVDRTFRPVIEALSSRGW